MGVSAQPSEEQREFGRRMHIGFPLVNDAAHQLGETMGLPTFDAGGLTLYKRITMMIVDNTIVKVWYPVFPPDRNATDVLDYLSPGS